MLPLLKYTCFILKSTGLNDRKAPFKFILSPVGLKVSRLFECLHILHNNNLEPAIIQKYFFQNSDSAFGNLYLMPLQILVSNLFFDSSP